MRISKPSSAIATPPLKKGELGGFEAGDNIGNPSLFRGEGEVVGNVAKEEDC
jgi:hypothetical protein